MVAAFAWWMAGCGDDDSPTDPGNGDTLPETLQPPDERYEFYVLDPQSPIYRLAHVRTVEDTILDTLTLGDGFTDIDVLPGGEQILAYSSDTGLLLNPQTLGIEGGTAGARFYRLDHGRDLAIRITTGSVYREVMSTWATTDSASANLRAPQIDTTNQILYAVLVDGILFNKVYRYDYSSGLTLIDSLVMADSSGRPLAIGELLPVPQYQRLYFFGQAAGEDVGVYVYDLAAGEVIVEFPTSGTGGRFVSFDAGSVVYQSDPRITSASGEIRYFNVASDAVGGTYSTAFDVGGGQVYLQVADMAITPDGRYLYAVGELQNALLRIDLEAGAVVGASVTLSGSSRSPALSMGTLLE